MAVARYLTNTPLVCGHDFRAEVSPRANERVWCHACFDYRHVGKPQPAAKPKPKPAASAPAKPKATPARKPKATPARNPKRERGWRPTRQVCSSCRLERPVVGACGDCPEDLG